MPSKIKINHGFPVPVSEWLKSNNGLGNVVSVLLDERSKKRGFYNQSTIKALIQKKDISDKEVESVIYPLLSLELWIRMFLEGDNYSQYKYYAD